MSAKAIREFDGKHLLAYHLSRATTLQDTSSGNTVAAIGDKFVQPSPRLAQICFDPSNTNISTEQVLDQAERLHPWLLTTKLVAKPDQLIKRRGKSGLLLLSMLTGPRSSNGFRNALIRRLVSAVLAVC